jgi:hypothetical protein
MSARGWIGVAVASVLLLTPTVASAQALLQPEKRARVEEIVVTFRDPVLVGDRILMGKYVIEHDNGRMARGRPCTHIYAYDDRRLPVVAFHCRHLNRPHSAAPTVTLLSLHDSSGLRRLTEFQFRGEAAGHGVPTGR